MKVLLDGKFVDAANAKVSVFDHGFLFGDGVYETLRTYGGRIWQPEEHLRRLDNSAALLGIAVPWRKEKIRKWMEELIIMNKLKEARLRITVTRGSNGYDFTGSRKPTILITAVEWKNQPGGVYKKGVDTVTFRMERQLPEAKTISLLPMVLAGRFLAEKKAYEAIFVGGAGLVREGTITNVFMVKKNILYTPKSGMLRGTTREAVIKAARRGGLKVLVRDFRRAELLKADEVFITNAPRGIVPVRTVDGKKIGRKCPGPVTIEISALFNRYIESTLK